MDITLTIKKTTDYQQFKTKKGNREITKNAVERLIKSISKKNLLQGKPIVVNENMEVIDGQHRLAAAKQMNIPIYYLTFESARLPDIQLLNANMRVWTARDFMESYITMGKANYKVFKEFWERWSFPFTATLHILYNPDKKLTTGLHRIFKEGNLPSADMERAEQMAQTFDRILLHANPFVRHSNPFYYTIIRLMKKDPHIVEEIIAKLQGGAQLYRVGTINEYLQIFEAILNKGRMGRPIRLY